MRLALRAVALSLVIACGPSPAPTSAPTGTLVVVIRRGPERVPFQPKVDRIRRANEQLASILGHSIQIEIDGSLLPQDHDGAQDVIARLVEQVARDLDGLKSRDAKALPFASTTFERLVVRYSPAEAAKRGRWKGAELDRSTKTIDVVLEESRWLALERGEIASPILRAFEGDQAHRYARVLPDALSASEKKAWLDYQLHGRTDPAPGQVVGSVDTLQVRGLVLLAREGEPEARRHLLRSTFGDFSSTYHHHQAEAESAPAGSPFRQAESAFVAYVRDTLPTMTVEERAEIARGLWVTDFRKSQERDPWASYSFPGLDPMAFGFAQADAWIAANHPSRVEVYDRVLDPVHIETAHGDLRYQPDGRSDADFYRWALAAPQREDAFVKGLLARSDPAFVTSAFYNAHSALRDEVDYIRFLRRFEASPAHWRAGAEAHRAVVYRPSPALLEESRRQWREVPIARPHALLYFARFVDGSYHPDDEWPDLLQEVKIDDAILKENLALGWQAFSLVPVFWRQVARSSGRVAILEAAAQQMYATDARAAPGEPDVSGILAKVGALDCADGLLTEVAALRSWAQSRIASAPGRGMSEILEATDPKVCVPTKRPAPRPPARKAPPKKPKWKEGDPLPPKDPFP